MKSLSDLDHVLETTTQMGPFGTRRMSRTVAISGGLCLVLFFVARFALEATALSPWLRVGIALLPLPAFTWFLWAFVRSVRDSDELERRVQLEALAVAFPLTMLLIMTLGLLQIAIPLPPDDWSYRHIWPLLYVFYLIGLVQARKRYL